MIQLVTSKMYFLACRIYLRKVFDLCTPDEDATIQDLVWETHVAIWVGPGTGYLLAMTWIWILDHPMKTISYSFSVNRMKWCTTALTKGNFRALGSISDPPAIELVAPRALTTFLNRRWFCSGIVMHVLPIFLSSQVMSLLILPIR